MATRSSILANSGKFLGQRNLAGYSPWVTELVAAECTHTHALSKCAPRLNQNVTSR